MMNAFICLALTCTLLVQAQGTDMIITNAKITTLDDSKPSASALAVRDGRFTQIGSNAEILALKSEDTQVIDAGGRRLIPGLNDSHLHVVRGGRFYNLELRWEGVPSLKEGLDMIRRQAKRTPKGHWVRVIGGWSPFQFDERRMPTPQELNEAAPDTPVFVLFLYSGGILNKAAMKTLGVHKDSVAPKGSRYERDVKGNPTGVLIADPNPMILYKTIAALPHMSRSEQVNSSKHFFQSLSKLGLTSAIDAGGGGHTFPTNYEATRHLAEQNELPLRISAYLFPQRPKHEHADFESWMQEYKPNQDLDRFREDGYVIEGGGELLVWSASDYENFLSDRPELKPEAEAELERVIRLHLKNRWPFRIHATYDQSISRMLDVLEKIDREVGFKGLRWAFDHAETVSEANLLRIKALGGGIAIQSRMAYAGEYFLERYGKSAASAAPPVRRMLELGIPVGGGTDGTRVSSFNPWDGIYWLVSGKTVGGTPLKQGKEKLSRTEALKLYTHGSAWFSGEEGQKGRIKEGYLADFTLLKEDYFQISEEAIKSLEADLTVVGGRIEYGSANFKKFAKTLPKAQPAWSPTNLK